MKGDQELKRCKSVWVALSLCLLFGGLVAGVLSAMRNATLEGGREVSSGSPRVATDAPIKVFNDSAWASVPGITGTGIWGDPYVISGKEIDAGTTDAGIWVENTTKYFIIQDCNVTGGANFKGGIYLVNASNGQVMGNNCSGNTGPGIFLYQGCKNISVEDNTASANDAGILLFQLCVNITVDNNTVSGNNAGITVSKRSDGNTITGNNATGNLDVGICLSNATNNLITGNNCSLNTWDGIDLVLTAYNNTISDNAVTENQHRGIYILDSSNNTFTNNNATGNLNTGGIFLEGTATNNTVSWNCLAGNANGIYLKNAALNNTFNHNNATGNTYRGVNVTVGADGNWFVGNNFSANVAGQGWDAGALNHWDNGSAGNIWSDYVGGVDANDDLTGDTPYTVAGPAGAKDNYPYCDDGNDIGPVILSTGLPDFGGVTAPSFALAIQEPYGLAEIWVSYTGGIFNYSCSAAGNLPQWSSIPNGTYTITFWAYDTDNLVGGVTVLLHKDIIAPQISCPGMPDGTSYTGAPMFTLDIRDAQLHATWYTLGDDPTQHYYTGSTCTIDAGAWAELPAGTVIITFYADDTLGNVRTFPIMVIKMVPSDMGWLWFAVIGGVIGVALAIGVLRKKRKGHAVAP